MNQMGTPCLNRHGWVVLVVMAMLLGSVSWASAQDRRQPKVIELDEDVIKGRVQKPEAFYILQHASLNYQRLDPKESFIPELVKSVKEEPF
ncbi:MAG: hypothetical protein AAFS10_12605 [Myxococcota bacterium]